MASAASPPIIPITNAQAVAAAAASSPASVPASAPAFRQFISRATDSCRQILSHGRPWAELVDRSAFSRPESLSEATSRIRKNVSYFRANYAALLALSLAFSLLSHPVSLLLLVGLLFAWCFLYLFRPSDSPLVIVGRSFSNRETVGGLVILSVVVILVTNVVSLLMSAIMVGAVVVCTHGAMRLPEDLFLDDQEPGGAATGFLSFFSGAASSAVAAVGPAVAGRV